MSFLKAGEQLLIERNIHICIAEEYSWDTIEYYLTDPITTDSDNEKIKSTGPESQFILVSAQFALCWLLLVILTKGETKE